jgi:hypothetical protein
MIGAACDLAIAVFSPGATCRLIGVNTPFIPRLQHDPMKLPRGLGDDFYIALFKNMASPRQVSMPMGAYLAHACIAKVAYHAKHAADTYREWDNLEFLNMLKADETPGPVVLLLDEADFAYYHARFERSGLSRRH